MVVALFLREHVEFGAHARRMDAPIVLVELDPVSLEIVAELGQIAEPVVGIYNRHSIAMSATPRGLAFVWTEGPIGPDNLRPFLRLYDCCVGD